MTDKEQEQRENRYLISMGFCEVCGKSLNSGDAQPQFAHAIGNTETNRNLYGSFFIDSKYNGKYVCSLGCNASVDVGKSKGAILKQLAYILSNEIKDFKGKSK